ncbi:MAG: WYL domain-containing protein [Candidatus Cybelea sp.]
MAPRLGKARKSGDPTAATARKIGILLDLVRSRAISLKGCISTYRAEERTVLRDLQELRKIGETAGFHITEREHGDTFRLSEFKGKPPSMIASEKRVRALMAELFKSYGEPMHELSEGLSDPPSEGSTDAKFVHFVQPQLVDGSGVRRVFDEIYAAWQNGARTEFTYKGQKRTIDPGAIVVRAGRYYLVGRDVSKRAWRTFSMDLIEGQVRRAGTFERRPAPAKYLSRDAIGFFKGDGEPQTVEVTFSKDLALAASSRRWQAAQKLHLNDDGTATISLTVDDVDEVVRWALGFGDEAWISSPPAVVMRAKETLAHMRRRYE